MPEDRCMTPTPNPPFAGPAAEPGAEPRPAPPAVPLTTPATAPRTAPAGISTDASAASAMRSGPGARPVNARPAGEPILVASGLTKRYRQVVALADVAITLHGGSSTAVVGPSGSGKSTLLHCLAGFTRPDAGQVTLDGMAISQLGQRTATRLRRERFGFVFQSDQLLGELPAVENVALPLMLGGMSRRAAIARASEWFAPLELNGLESRRPGQLSGGQVQRVSIARALVVAPSVVFADEPTAALDRSTSATTMQVLTDSCRHVGAALLVVTHDPDVAAACDRTVTMRDGRIHEVVTNASTSTTSTTSTTVLTGATR